MNIQVNPTNSHQGAVASAAYESALSTSTLYRNPDDGYRTIPKAYSTAKHIEKIVILTKDLVNLSSTRLGPTASPAVPFSAALNRRLQNALHLHPQQLQEHFPRFRLHPYVDLFVRCALAEDMYEWHVLRRVLTRDETKQYEAARQRMLTAVQAGARERGFKRQVKSHEDKVRRNLKCIRRYTDAQFTAHARLLVMRVDCMFNVGFPPAHDWGQARTYRAALIKFLNRDLPKLIQSKANRIAGKKPAQISGYIIGTEYGVESGWHFHTVVFLDGSEFENDVGIASLISTSWMRDITGGNGRYYNCNLAAKIGNYRDKDGVGMIHRTRDAYKREVLNNVVIRYAGKGCYFAEAQTGPKDRLLCKGAWPKPKDPRKGGRPESPWLAPVLTQVFSEKTKRFHLLRQRVEPLQPRVSF